MDRNKIRIAPINGIIESLSARRAWIEIVELHLYASSGVVALRKESVDRNFIGGVNRAINISRSPQGERG